MKSKSILLVAIALIVSAVTVSTYNGMSIVYAEDKHDNKEYTKSFNLDECGFSSTGSNRYFILEPGYQLVLEGKEGKEKVILTITVLDETKIINGIETRIIEEKETRDGTLSEISKNYFAICTQNNSVFYFGEDVDIFDGEIVRHDGSWIHGANNAKAGLMMPGIALLGSRYHQETATDVAMDRSEIVSIDEKVKTPAGKFENSLKTKETTPLEPSAEDFKTYAPHIGLVKANTLKLVKYGYV